MTTVTRDATSLKFWSASAAEWIAYAAGTGVSGSVNNLYQMTETASPCVDSVNAANISGVTSGFTPPSGWSRSFAFEGDTGGGSLVNTSHASLPDLSTTSFFYHGFLANSIASPSASPAGLLLMGPGGTESDNIVVEYTGGHWVLTDGTNTTTGTINHGTGVVPFALRYDQTNSKIDLWIDTGANAEHITKTFVRPSSGAKGIWLGAAYHSTEGTYYGGLATLKGSSAEMTDAAVVALMSRFNTGAVVSIAVTPSSPSILVTNTQQMTAIATFQDGSTLDVTSNPLTVWTSGTPSVATITTTGLLTGASVGTSSVTAAFGGVTSGADLVTIIGITTPNKYTRMLWALLPPGKLWRR